MSNSYLKAAANLIKGDLSQANDELKAARDAKNGVLWKVLCNLICYANNEVFQNGYTRKLAKQFKVDLMSETGLGEKQASRYTEAVSAGLGVRGVRKGMRSIEGLPAAAADGIKMVEQFLNAADIKTFNQFISATKEEKSPVEKAAEVLSKLTLTQRERAVARAAELDKADDDTAEG